VKIGEKDEKDKDNIPMIIGVSLNEWAHSKAHDLPIDSARHIIRKVDEKEV
jgi:hypothetical protein